jgi:hypothetical protein
VHDPYNKITDTLCDCIKHLFQSDSNISSDSDFEQADASTHVRPNNNNRLPPFTGKEKWRVLINRFEAVADLYDWSGKERLSKLLPRLQDAAGDFVYDQLSSTITKSYKKLTRELGNRFGEVDTTRGHHYSVTLPRKF